MWHSMQIVSIGDHMHQKPNPVSGKVRKNISVCHLLQILPRALSFKIENTLFIASQHTSTYASISPCALSNSSKYRLVSLTLLARTSFWVSRSFITCSFSAFSCSRRLFSSFTLQYVGNCMKILQSNFNGLNIFCFITKTRLFKYIENFISKNWKFSDKKLIFFIFLLKT